MTSQHKSSSKSLAKNTLILYFRAIFTMVVAFYSTRLLLEALGIEGFGVANVVSSVVTMFSMVVSVLNTTTSRYYNFELSQEEGVGFNKIFNLTIQLYITLGIILIIILESVGIRLIVSELKIPLDYRSNAIILYHFSVASLFFNLCSIPYSSAIIANEDMKYYARITMFDSVFKFFGVFVLSYINFNQIAFYGALLFLVSLSNLILNYCVCKQKYNNCNITRTIDIKKSWELLKFGAWNLWGSGANVCSGALVNIVLNNHYGVVVNSARAIALQVSSGTNMFVSNFIMACNPRIHKLYAANDTNMACMLAINASRYSFLLFFVLAVPIYAVLDELLDIWLVDVPKYASIFTTLVLIQVIFDSMSLPLMTLIQSTGKIALYQSVVGGLIMMNFPISYLICHLDGEPELCFIASIALSIICLLIRLYLLRSTAGLSIRQYLKYCFIKCCGVAITMVCLLFILYFYNNFLPIKLFSFQFLFFCTISILLTLSIGTSSDEKKYIYQFLIPRFRNISGFR